MKLHFIRDETKTVNDVMYITSVLEKGIRFTSVLDYRWRIALKAVIMSTQCKGYQPTVLQTAFLIHCCTHHDDSGSQEYDASRSTRNQDMLSNVLPKRKNYPMSQTGLSPIRSGIALDDTRKLILETNKSVYSMFNSNLKNS